MYCEHKIRWKIFTFSDSSCEYVLLTLLLTTTFVHNNSRHLDEKEDYRQLLQCNSHSAAVMYSIDSAKDISKVAGVPGNSGK
jgi:hypothetical protein